MVVGGVMYVTGSWSVVHALDARTGAPLWAFDPEVRRRSYALLARAFHLLADVPEDWDAARVRRRVRAHQGAVRPRA